MAHCQQPVPIHTKPHQKEQAQLEPVKKAGAVCAPIHICVFGALVYEHEHMQWCIVQNSEVLKGGLKESRAASRMLTSIP